MEFEHHNFSVEDNFETGNNLRESIYKYSAYWKWFVISIILSVLLAFLYIRYSVPKYEVSASILIKDDKKGGALSELSAFQDLGILKNNSNIDNEIEILKSRTLMTRVVEELHLNIRCFINESPIPVEKYIDPPITLHCVFSDSSINIADEEFTIKILSKTKFILNDNIGISKGEKSFGEEIQTSFGSIVITSNDLKNKTFFEKEIKVIITPLKTVVDNYKEDIQINPVNKTSNVIEISLKDAVKEKAVDILNNLIKQHNADAISDKNQVSKNTAEFINERMQFVTSELSEVESNAEAYKTTHKLVDVVSEAGLFLDTETENKKNLLETNTQMRLADYMIDYILKHNNTSDLIPSNLGFSDPSIVGMTDTYNNLVLERNRILKNSSEKNPTIVNLDAQIMSLNKSLKESLNNLHASLQIKNKELTIQEENINSKIASVPKYEREYRTIQRQQQIKEALYLYLLQKREETAIALAVTVANAKIIDNAYSNGIPVSPKKKILYLIALFLGLMLPVVLIFIIDLLDTKVHGVKDINKINLPFLGDIPLSESKNRLIVTTGDRSSVGEAFRLLRTNVDFMMGSTENTGRTLFITSTLGKEGKSFISLNLASTIALSGKKVLLIGMDLRAPKTLAYLGLQENLGLSNYITDKNLPLDDIIIKVPNMENFNLLSSGPVPPNPAELLMNNRVKEMFEEVKKKYDYIIVDTAPVGLVTDTLLLSQFADSFVYVVRANFLDKNLLRVPETLYKEKRLPNMAILINGSDHKKNYGYGYGYGYGQEKPKPWWKKLF